jgi:hypothetical protein
MHLFGLGPRHFAWNPYGDLDGHADLQWGRRGKIKAPARNIQGFGEMVAFIGGHTG